MIRFIWYAVALALGGCALSDRPVGRSAEELQFPVKPEAFITQFNGAEGLTFNGEGRLFIGANKGVWIAEPDGSVRKIADVYTHLGQAGIGRRDILAADFGPTNAFRDGPNDDGIVWRITPEGKKTIFATGIGDPNFILKMPDGNWLVSDDATDKIYTLVNGKAEIWSSSVPFPNGLALSRDGRLLYAAQIFRTLKPISFDDSLWAIPVSQGRQAGDARLVIRTGGAGLDGLIADERGRIYIADNRAGKVRRYDPETNTLLTIAEGIPGVASLVFGEGKFDRTAIYATTTESGGGTIWKIKVGVRGARQFR